MGSSMFRMSKMRWTARRQAAGVSERKVHVLLESSGLGRAGSADRRRGKTPVRTGVRVHTGSAI